MIIEKSMALGAAILIFPEGNAVQAGGVCGPGAIPDPNDPGWIDWQRIETWDYTRKGVKYEEVKDGTTGRMKLVDEIETDGATEYKFTSNVILAYILGIFFRGGALNGNSLQFNPDAYDTPRCWMILDKRDGKGNLIFSANLWGRLKSDALKGGGGALVKPEVMFTQYANNLNVAAIGQ